MHTDALGGVHPIASESSRVVSLVPSLTELLLDLGVPLVGRTGYCIHPAGLVDSVAKIGGTKTVNIEKIRKLAPEYAVLNLDENTRETADALREFVPNLVVTHPKTLSDNLELFALFGEIFSGFARVTERAQVMENTLRAGLKFRAQAMSQRVLYLIWKDPWMTISADTYIADVLQHAGASTVYPRRSGANPRFPSFELQDVDWSACDRVLLSSEPFAFTAKHAKDLALEIAKISGRDLPCEIVDGELMSWFGSRSLKTVDYCASLSALWANPLKKAIA